MATKFGPKRTKIFTRLVRFSGSANSNKLTEISREPRELPWQPILGKNKLKTHQFQFCAKNPVLSHSNSKVFGVGEIKYALRNFQGAKGVAMATKFGQK